MNKIYLAFALPILLLLHFTPLSAQEKEKYHEYSNKSLEELMNIEISTAGKKVEKVSAVPASVVIINRNEIAKYGYQSVEEILESVPGLYLIDDYNWLGQKNYGVRGYFSTGAFDNMIVLINGVNQKSEGLLDSYPTERIEVPVESIDRIEIIRGPMSVMYGSGAFFGAINIITTGPTGDENHNVISGSMGNQNMYKLYAGLSGKSGEISYSINGYIFSDDGIDQPFSKMMSNPSIVTDAQANGGWNLNSDNTKGRLKTKREYFNVNGTFRDFTFDFGLIHSQKNVAETIFGVGDGSWVHYTNTHASIFYNKKFSDKFSFETKLSYFSDNHQVDNNFYFENSYTNNWSRAHIFETEVISKFTPTPQLSLIAGIFVRSAFDLFIEADYTGLGYLPDLEITYDDDIISQAVYTQMDYSPMDNLKLIAGLRLERLSSYNFDLNLNYPVHSLLAVNQPPVVISGEFIPQNDFEFIPRAGLIYSINDSHIIKLLYGKAIKQPNATANLDVALNNSPQLKPAEIETFEVNYNGTHSPNFVSYLSLFYNKLDNLISRKNVLTEDGSIIISSNAGNVTTVGVETGIQLKPINELMVDVNFTYQKSENKRPGFEDFELAYSPEILAYVKVLYDAADDISLAAQLRYIDKMYAGIRSDIYDHDNIPIMQPDDPLQGRLGYSVPSHITVDLNLRLNNLFGSQFYLNAKASNIFDEDIFYPTTSSNPAFDKGTLGRGRTFLITLGWNLTN